MKPLVEFSTLYWAPKIMGGFGGNPISKENWVIYQLTGKLPALGGLIGAPPGAHVP